MNGWRWTDQAITRPHRCSVFPQVGNGTGHSFIDVNQRLDLEQVYISDVAADEIAQFRGWVHPQQLKRVQERVAELEAQNAQLAAENADHEKRWGALDVIESGDFRRRNKTGRKPKKKEETSAVG